MFKQAEGFARPISGPANCQAIMKSKNSLELIV